jgi:hypothetical protein
MTQDNLLLYLIVSTFGLALAYGMYQWFRARKARREHHHSAKQRQDAAAERGGATGAPPQVGAPRKFL